MLLSKLFEYKQLSTYSNAATLSGQDILLIFHIRKLIIYIIMKISLIYSA